MFTFITNEFREHLKKANKQHVQIEFIDLIYECLGKPFPKS